MESWQIAFRNGLAPLLSDAALEALAEALRTDDSKLIQGATTQPPPLSYVQDWPVEAACAVGYCAVVECGGFGEALVGQVEEYFARLCYDMDQQLGEPGGCRHLLNFIDSAPRDEMRRELLAEVGAELGRRGAARAV
jgi:hypothetical protein